MASSPPSKDPHAFERRLRERFPNLRTSFRLPVPRKILGIGTAWRGRRDDDEDSATHVATLSFMVGSIALFHLGAYRISHAPRNQGQIVGAEPVTGPDLLVNVLFLGAVLATAAHFGWQYYESTPPRRADRHLAKAAEAMAAGNPRAAMEEYLAVIDGPLPRADEAERGFRAGLDALAAGDRPADLILGVSIAAQRSAGPDPLVPDLVQRAIAATPVVTERNPAQGGHLLARVNPLVRPEFRTGFDILHADVLTRWIAAEPARLEPALRLALIRERQEETGAMIDLLEPHRDALGDGEGARLLGRALVAANRHAEGVVHLRRYAAPRLQNYLKARANLRVTADAEEQVARNKIQGNEAPSIFYVMYNASQADRREQLVADFIEKHKQATPRYTTAAAEVARLSPVIQVVLDMGAGLVRTARGQDDPEVRRATLEEAEKAFLSVREEPADPLARRLSGAEVCFRVDRGQEGRRLLEEHVNAATLTGDKAWTRLRAAGVLLQVGDRVGSRAYFEQAWELAPTLEGKNRAAWLRAQVAKDIDDRLLWLGRCPGNYRGVRSGLAEARASKYLLAGNRTQAEVQARTALQHYEKDLLSVADLAGSARLYLALYAGTRDPADLRESARRCEAALAMQPDDTLLADLLLEIHLEQHRLDLAGPDAPPLPPGGAELLADLACANEAVEREVCEREARGEAARRARALADLLMVLAPCDSSAPRARLRMAERARDADALRALRRHLEAVDFAPDARSWDEVRSAWSGGNREELALGRARNVELWTSLQAGLAANAPAAVRAVARVMIVNGRIRQWSHGEGSVSPEELTAEAHALAVLRPGRVTWSLVLQARAVALLQEACDGDAAVKDLCAKHAAWIDPTSLLTLVLAQSPGREALLHSQHAAAMQAALQAKWGAYPGRVDENDLPLAVALALPESAGRLDQWKSDPAAQDAFEINLRLGPETSAGVFTCCQLLDLKGEADRARQLWKTATTASMPLPPLSAVP